MLVLVVSVASRSPTSPFPASSWYLWWEIKYYQEIALPDNLMPGNLSHNPVDS